MPMEPPFHAHCAMLQAQETLPSYPDICFAVDDYDNTFEAVVCPLPCSATAVRIRASPPWHRALLPALASDLPP